MGFQLVRFGVLNSGPNETSQSNRHYFLLGNFLFLRIAMRTVIAFSSLVNRVFFGYPFLLKLVCILLQLSWWRRGKTAR